MSKLSNTIHQYYLFHFTELPIDKQFHFASRLYLWDGDDQAALLLKDLRSDFTANDRPAEALRTIFQAAQASPIHGSKNAAELRRPYFEKYPALKTYVTLLFRINFLQTVYDIDCRDMFYELCPQTEVDAMVSQLLQDEDALAILSTHAVNFLYLYSHLITENNTLFDPALFLRIGRSAYDLTNPTHLQLLIYLYTHCIIGESQFYYRPLSKAYLSTYQTMIAELESLIGERFDQINLDNKFEFLVCASMIGFTSQLAGRIHDEAERSLSPDGSFLIDRHNSNPQTANLTLDASEHRNVLFILSEREYRPLG